MARRFVVRAGATAAKGWEAGMRVLVGCVSLLLLANCGVGPGITGNESGGIIPYALVAAQPGSNRVVAAAMASDFCAHYNKRSRVKTINRKYGDYVTFECNWSFARPGP